MPDAQIIPFDPREPRRLERARVLDRPGHGRCAQGAGDGGGSVLAAVTALGFGLTIAAARIWLDTAGAALDQIERQVRAIDREARR